MRKIIIPRFFIFYLLSSVIVIATSCKRPSKDIVEVEFEFDQVNYPISVIPNLIVTDISHQDSLYPISDDFLRNFFELATHYQGTPITIQSNLPTTWGVRNIERLPEGKDLWLLQSQNREWIYLAVTAGSGTQRILDVLPVAVNIVMQHQDVIETEVWQTRRKEDGTFVVEKSYEWTKSVGEATREEVEANPHNFNRKNFVVNCYELNEMGRFDFIEEDEIPDYNVAFFYFHQNEKPQEWDEVMEKVQSFCEERNIYFDELSDNFQEAFIRDYKLNDLITVDISPYADEFLAGMVLMKKGEEPKNVIFGSEERLKIEIKRYFKLLNQ